MKKTLIALMALASVAMAEETINPVLTLNNIPSSSIDLSGCITGNAFTVAVVLDYDTVKGYLLSDGVRDANNNYINHQLVNVGTNADMTQGSRIGATICYADNSAIRGTWNEATWNQANSGGFKFGSDLGEFDNLKWEEGSYATYVLTYSYETGSTGVFTIHDDNGAVLSQVGGDFYLNLRGNTFDPNALALHSSVTSAYVYNQGLTSAQAKAIGATLVPEPATATLSLLALAGLAARRRRK